MVDHEKEQTLPPTPDKRQADRITTETPIILVDEKGREWITETIDISSSGIAFTVPKGCALNEGALLQVKIPVDDTFLAGLVEIKSSRMREDQRINGVMIPFKNPLLKMVTEKTPNNIGVE